MFVNIRDFCSKLRARGSSSKSSTLSSTFGTFKSLFSNLWHV
ncbi:hypothetical protein F383_37767 [Gossypium arboreum]|uniref:Uncharacterized protein n=1 Tax=Gossypium arboreum TaxID=29729 RepID=A0A0B0M956_GOSAR|nr:hypothetical protein F383_37767 [Gossypium arboreum]